MRNQTGSILIWTIIVGLLIAGIIGGVWYYQQQAQNQLETELSQDRVMPSELSVDAPSPSPDYSLAKDNYNLNDKQIEILSKVVNDDKL